MPSQVSAEDWEQINVGIREKYNKVAVTPEGHFKYPTGREGFEKGFEKLHYDDKLIAKLSYSIKHTNFHSHQCFSRLDSN
jgi:hypothetical protein